MSLKLDLSQDVLNRAWNHGWESANVFRLNIPKRSWSGLHGHLKKQGTGQSIDFNDHRPYVNGDDIRFVNWKTFARTGQLVLKTFEEEVSPYADIVVDFSESMFLTEEKTLLLMSSIGFLVASCRHLGFEVHLTIAGEDGLKKMEGVEATVIPDFPNKVSESTLNLDVMEWHSQSLRVLVSDLLFPMEPSDLLKSITKSKGVGYLFCPYDQSESSPSWEDVTEIEEVETEQKHWLHASPNFIKQYQQRYLEHFKKWEDSCHGAEFLFMKWNAQLAWRDNLKHSFPSIEVI